MTAKDMIWELRKRGWLLKQIGGYIGAPVHAVSDYARGRREPIYSVGKRLEELMEVPIPKSNVVQIRRQA